MNPGEYKGHLNTSVSGHKCRAWMDDAPGDNPNFHKPASYPNLSVAEALNYCRSPNGYPALWCYVDSGGVAWDHCGSHHVLVSSVKWVLIISILCKINKAIILYVQDLLY